MLPVYARNILRTSYPLRTTTIQASALTLQRQRPRIQSPIYHSSLHRGFAKMVKPEEQVIEEFNTYVNMSASELSSWLETEASTSSGWSKNDGSGESVGHDSGRHIVRILEKNPNKDPEKYDEDDISHMRKVVSYCKRHLAQEEKAKMNTDSKSYKSLKNWGHDPLKA
ncbi:hypothetical protein DL546_005744 [Coniochaeta pulveracea]|uniref:Uncharacterized protein n=1 Tax=Coniochaeta pulveracea TaxID=177199 RepID=A0A420Y6D5_9PEZI|nr:hypothetical protein DL546_005744 [Coniochaeta pulveracea]